MPRKTKRQLQVNKILRKKGCYISRETEIETVEGEKWMDNKNINKWAEGEIVEDQIEDEINNDLTKDLKEFEKVEKKLITEVLCWHEKATSSIRTAYNKTLRTTIWRNTKKKEELACDAKGMRTLDTLFRSTEKSINMPLPQSLKPQSLSPSPFLSFETTSNSSLISKEITRNLQIRLDEINQQCTVTKNVKMNKNVFTYNYLHHLKSHTPGNLKVYIEGMVFPKLTGHIKKDTISEKICRNYMYLWGYKYDERKKGGYYNGHERPDVVKYRKKWLKRMFKYQRLMKDFNSDMMDIVSEPQLKPGDKELVQIMYDECHFYANDG
ncbi:unnamed protein product [Rhizophagus irregularis]|nr:unnamed protein product [Rhizophagus irregularis]